MQPGWPPQPGAPGYGAYFYRGGVPPPGPFPMRPPMMGMPPPGMPPPGMPPPGMMPPGMPPPGMPPGVPPVGVPPVPAARPPIVGGVPTARPSSMPPPQNTTLWVGRIAASVQPAFMQQLLEACGPLREWKPVLEPDSGRPKGFGFVTYAEPEGVLVALQVLNNLRVDGQELTLKANKATEEFLAYHKQQKAEQQQQKTGEGEGGAEGGDAAASAAAAEPSADAALAKVMELISQRPAVAGAPNPEPASAAAAADTFLSSLGGASSEGGGRGGGERKRERSRERDREAEREAERERQRQRREEARRAEAEERAYREAVRAWEDKERQRARELERERDRQADLQRERQRQMLADNEAPDSDAEEEPWRRRPYGGSRRAADRRRRREAEEAEDAADRRKEAEEREAAAAAAAAAPQQAEEAAAPGASFGADDTILQAMLAAVKPKEQAAPAPAAAPAAAASAAVPAGAAKRRVRPTFAADDDEENKPQRKLIPIRYSEEELRALQQPADGAQQAVAAPAVQSQQLDPAALKRQLLGLIPKDKAAAFAFPVNWPLLDAAPPEVHAKISGWVGKKVQELLGEEPAFVEFVMKQLREHKSAQEMYEALADVLDEDAESFTLKLWQILIYEQLKLERSKQ